MNSIESAKEIVEKELTGYDFYMGGMGDKIRKLASDFLEAVKCLEHYAQDSSTCTYDTKEFLEKLK